MIISLGEMLSHDPTLISIMDLPLEKAAFRENIGDSWEITDL